MSEEERCKYCGVTDHPSHLCNGYQLRKELSRKIELAKELLEALKSEGEGTNYQHNLIKKATEELGK